MFHTVRQKDLMNKSCNRWRLFKVYIDDNAKSLMSLSGPMELSQHTIYHRIRLLSLADEGQPTPLISDEKTNWFYHDADLKDVDQDGHFDVVIDRANVPGLASHRID